MENNKGKLIFEENFNGTSLDTNTWNITVAGNGFGNNEDQYYVNSSKNIVVNNSLKIVGLKEKHENREYTSAKLTSKQSFKYGHFEITCKIPKGKGAWPAIWMLPLDIKETHWPRCGEIDIVETIGKTPNIMHFSLHTEKYNHILKTQRTYFLEIPNANEEYKLYEMDWTSKYIRFFADKKEIVTFYKDDPNYDKGIESWPFDKPFFLICNLAIGGNWGGQIDDEAFPMIFDIKSIKVYEIKE